MSVGSNPTKTRQESFGSKLRNTAIGFLFAVVLLIPKMLHVRRNENSWMAFRIFLGLVGAGLVVLPLSLWSGYSIAIVGLVMFISAILLPPAKPDTTVDDKARELGALVVVNGGLYQPGNLPLCAVQLFVGEERIWALDLHFQPVLVIPVLEMTQARAELSEGQWHLRVRWSDHKAEFSYRGVFAEHLARTAESTLQSVMKPTLPVLPSRARAASA